MSVPTSPPGLSRSLGLTALILYGIGDILGAGIYALVGKVAGISGQAAWISFGVSAVLAAVTGLAYAEMTSRVPQAAGAAAFAARAFRHPLVPYVVGFFVLASGVTSTAAVSRAFYGYLKVFLNIPELAAALGLIALVSYISFRGISLSAGVNNVLTVIEVSGLLLVIFLGLKYASGLPAGELASRVMPDTGLLPILTGSTIAFYAFIGFEDLANLAEEAVDPSRNIPRAILAAVAVSTVIYLIVTFIVLWAMTPAQAAASSTPLLDVIKIAGYPLPDWSFAPVALVAVCNTGLANLIMGSRLLYGMAEQGLIPRVFSKIHPGRRTPWVAILAVMGLCVLLVVTGGVQIMAQTTSLLLMTAFLVVHLSLIIVRRQDPDAEAIFKVPGFVPYVGIVACVALALRSPPAAWGRMLGVLALALVLYVAVPRSAPKSA